MDHDGAVLDEKSGFRSFAYRPAGEGLAVKKGLETLFGLTLSIEANCRQCERGAKKRTPVHANRVSKMSLPLRCQLAQRTQPLRGVHIPGTQPEHQLEGAHRFLFTPQLH